jgi:hypothetical protein
MGTEFKNRYDFIFYTIEQTVFFIYAAAPKAGKVS